MNLQLRRPAPRPQDTAITAAGLGLLALATVGPLILAARGATLLRPYEDPTWAFLGRLGVLAVLGLVVAVRAALDRRTEPHPFALAALLLGLAAGMTAAHWVIVDRDALRQAWQRDIYLEAVNLTGTSVPHV